MTAMATEKMSIIATDGGVHTVAAMENKKIMILFVIAVAM